MTFELEPLSEKKQADFKADGRMRAFLAMKGAFKKRAREKGVTVQKLSKAIGRDKGQVSRILSGRSAGVTLDTLVLITSALGFRLSFDATPVEVMNKRNRNVAPHPIEPVALQYKDHFNGTALYAGGGTNAKTGVTYISIVGDGK
jgi:transcriptional regulator with XRE-family HTH domain